MLLDNNQQAFFALVRAGLFPVHGEGFMVLGQAKRQSRANESLFRDVDWEKIYQLAAEQSVQGLVLAGIEKTNANRTDSTNRLPQELLWHWIGEVQMIEQQNLAMNKFVAQLIEKLRQEDIYALLVKGQGIAQCYERPLWRACGDVDLLLDAKNFEKAEGYFDSIANSRSLETAKNKERLHQEYQIGDWAVELHGTMHANLSRQMDRVIDQVQDDTFSKKQVRIWKDGETDVALPCPDNDVIFVCSHILQHLFFEGIGLRQICDWCRLLWTYKESLNRELLESRLRAMGVMSEWKILAAFAVKYLGMPADAMPFYDVGCKMYDVRAERLMRFILKVGNFGHNREVEWSNPFKRRSMLIWHRIIDTVRLSLVFPGDAPKFLVNYAFDGVKYLVLESSGGAWNNSTC